jgi:hypothetical protein
MDRDLERRIAYAFQDNCPSCPVGVVCESESPDFLLRTARGILGIEVTQLFRPSTKGELPRQARERYLEDLVLEARNLYESRGGLPIDVAVMFTAGASPTPHRRRELAAYIADAVPRRNLPDLTPVIIECDESNYQSFPDEIAWVRVFRYGVATESCWVVQDFDWGLPYPESELERLVAQKESLVALYRHHCDEAWLLIAVGVGGFSSRFENPQALRRLSSSLFTRVVLFDALRLQSFELWQAPSTAT